MNWQEEFLQTLVDSIENATPEERETGTRMANNFVYSRLSYAHKERAKAIEQANELERRRQEELKESIREGTRTRNQKFLTLFQQVEEAQKENKEVVLV